MQDRRRFILKGATLVAAGAAATVVDAPNVIAQPRFQWRMPTYVVPRQRRAARQRLRSSPRWSEEMSGGRFKIQVFAAGELMPAPGRASTPASQGTVETYNAAAYYWPGKEVATQWFTTVPFGLNPQGTYAWYYFGDGIKLWEETYLPFGLVPAPVGLHRTADDGLVQAQDQQHSPISRA